MNLAKLILFISAIIAITSCQRLDDNLYNPQKVTEYKRDAFNGDVDFRLDDSTYKIANSSITSFLLWSQDSSEKEGTPIIATYIGDIYKIKTDTVILYCHGNKNHMDFYWPRAKLLANILGLDTSTRYIPVKDAKGKYIKDSKGKLIKKRESGHGPRGLGVLYFDYRGFGLSKGVSSEKSLYADVNEALKYLKRVGCKEKNLIMYGFSLGCAPLCKLVADVGAMKPSKIILEAPFASAEAMIQSSASLNMPKSYYTDITVDNSQKIKKIAQPLMWIHGVKDDFIDIEQGQLVFDNHKGSYKEANKIANAGHSTIQTTWGFASYSKAVRDFIRKK
jgi:pimeloyl-ACP methyl ester carboxylesterase